MCPTTRAQQSKGNPKKGRGEGGSEKDEHGSGANLFLEKTYDMITKCDDAFAAWSKCDNHFIIKDTGIFEKEVIPQYFGKIKFSSFSRQLSYYKFRKVPIKSLRKDEIKPIELKWVRFHNKLFKRGKKELLVQIQRTTCGTQNQYISMLRKRVTNLEFEVSELRDLNSILESRLDRINEFLQSSSVPPAAAGTSISAFSSDMVEEMGVSSSYCKNPSNDASHSGTASPSFPMPPEMADFPALPPLSETTYRAHSLDDGVQPMANIQTRSLHGGYAHGDQVVGVDTSMDTNPRMGPGTKTEPTLPPHPKTKQGPPVLGVPKPPSDDSIIKCMSSMSFD
mmetsp:Transcript_11767/g.17150  ORF Transcript_11767/g.17150 Transcript_11767/m.17150 type:complete len:337 (-) Transcript_11767:255-1265(-)|eukprot:CAMPEP_0197241788 /NCGR_PEP_ID=MMETSP1429-20130617/7728_1 /TAXON_ID=49237 /ORGANISM="Chaetoceros  sp., Strain UNC1202" /LENGTH=336 /DNA_ID=CAMNT_0042701683 /DNA_START=80 /DNA_END=1090 /DNA_ORIENTATION=+